MILKKLLKFLDFQPCDSYKKNSYKNSVVFSNNCVRDFLELRLLVKKQYAYPFGRHSASVIHQKTIYSFIWPVIISFSCYLSSLSPNHQSVIIFIFNQLTSWIFSRFSTYSYYIYINTALCMYYYKKRWKEKKNVISISSKWGEGY